MAAPHEPNPPQTPRQAAEAPHDWIAALRHLAPPGDRERGLPALEGLVPDAVLHADTPAFEAAAHELHEAFGPAGEIEAIDILRRRLRRGLHVTDDGTALDYRLSVLRPRHATHERHDRHDDLPLAAIRDHTVIVPPPAPGRGDRDRHSHSQWPREAVVHLSHALVLPQYRGRGLGAWLRAMPIRAAHRTLHALGQAPPHRVTLVAEMEPLDPDDPATRHRLRVYQRAGFSMIDPAAVDYAQPCFTDDPGHPPLPLRLLIYWAGRERRDHLTGRQARTLVAALYTMYAADLPDAAMQHVRPCLDAIPDDDRPIRLVSPTHS